MANKVRFDEEGLKNALQTIVTEIHDTNDPTELNELRRLFRKYVPFFSRAYVAGLLLKRARIVTTLSSPTGNQASRRPERIERAEKPESRETRRPEKPAYTAPKKEAPVQEPADTSASANETNVSRENMTTLFVGIGRTRRVYPRDIMSLLIETSGLQKDDIGSIKILDNYSFVDVDTGKAQNVIDSLNNFEYRGRTLSVNFAKKKE